MEQQESLNNILKLGAKHWPEAFGEFRSTILTIHRIHSHLDSDLEKLLAGFELQKADFGVLTTLRRSASPYCLSPTELYRSMLFSSGGLTKVLSRVQKAGLIERIENPEDGRSKLVQLTHQGKTVVESIISQLHAQEKRKLDVLNEDEKNQLDMLLNKVLGNWE
ncbi:MarR family transcriptional regulator [Vibrio astriarenae]|uniref:MarR family transcriptional regulator n=1 Tax=Vibrio astriarenae TaxID=1481923 RepID=A0A7Z2YF03_9VIBR|nr:MarR family transcriptional regulator [Vibrio astriarenae]QIA64861.1 MarR family transcriptional regulator [Vibrio astriarenae]